MNDLISRQAAINALECIVDHHCITPYQTMRAAIDHAKRIISGLPSAQPEQRWNRMMMYLADLQLTYSTGWGANGQGDQKLYDFVTGLLEELQGWERGEENETD